jgi:hypothetical protein
MRGHVGKVDTTCPNFDEKEDVEGLQANRFDGEEITCQHGVLVVIEEGSPCRGHFPVGNRQYAVTTQNLTDCFMANTIAELFQFARDAVIAPLILASQLEHQLDDLWFDRRAPVSLRVSVEGPFAFDELAMPAEKGIGFEDQGQLLKLGFLLLDDRSESLNESQQHQFFSRADDWTTFLMTP